jgi:hypothetical protein
VLVFDGPVAAFGYPLAHGLTHFSQRLPSDVGAERGRGWIGQLVRRFHLQARILATLGTIFALLVLFLLEGPEMGRQPAHVADRRRPPGHRPGAMADHRTARTSQSLADRWPVAFHH